MKKLISILLTMLCISNAFAQNINNIKVERDSLIILFNKEKDDFKKMELLLDISNICEVNDIVDYAKPLVVLCDKLLASEKEEEKIYLIKSIKAESYNNIGYMYKIQGISSKAIENLYKSIEISEEIDNARLMADTYNNLGSAHQQQSDSESAINFFLKSLSIYQKTNDTEGLALTYNNLAYQYEIEKEYQKSIIYLNKSIVLWEELGSSIYKAYSLNNIGVNLGNLKLYDSALVNYFDALNVFIENDRKEDITWSYNLIGRLYFDKKDLPKAEHYLLKGLELTSKLKILETKRNILENLYVLYQYKKEYKKALNFHKDFIGLDNQIKNSETKQLALKKQLINKYDKIAIADSLKYEKETEMQEMEYNLKLEKEENQRMILYVGVFFLLVFGGFMYNRFRVTKKQKIVIEEQRDVVEEAHKEIRDSINYAERIQRSFLATDELLNNNLKDYFVFFQPKDVVSGDFYWAGKLSNNNFAVVNADSTGHGVPGAIMSILNISSIEKAIDNKLVKPADIFNHTRDTIIERLSKDGSDEGGKDGMDASIIAFDFKNNKFTYTAAQNPIWVIRNNELIEIKAEKMPIGKHDNDAIPFVGGEFETEKGDVVYTITDGFQDQFGGEKGKKFKVKPFKNYLISIAHLPMQEQKVKLNETFTTWKGDEEQVDDVCVIGVRI